MSHSLDVPKTDGRIPVIRLYNGKHLSEGPAQMKIDIPAKESAVANHLEQIPKVSTPIICCFEFNPLNERVLIWQISISWNIVLDGNTRNLIYETDISFDSSEVPKDESHMV
jgi:hypothetical protein